MSAAALPPPSSPSAAAAAGGHPDEQTAKVLHRSWSSLAVAASIRAPVPTTTARRTPTNNQCAGTSSTDCKPLGDAAAPAPSSPAIHPTSRNKKRTLNAPPAATDHHAEGGGRGSRHTGHKQLLLKSKSTVALVQAAATKNKPKKTAGRTSLIVVGSPSGRAPRLLLTRSQPSMSQNGLYDTAPPPSAAKVQQQQYPTPARSPVTVPGLTAVPSKANVFRFGEPESTTQERHLVRLVIPLESAESSSTSPSPSSSPPPPSSSSASPPPPSDMSPLAKTSSLPLSPLSSPRSKTRGLALSPHSVFAALSPTATATVTPIHAAADSNTPRKSVAATKQAPQQRARKSTATRKLGTGGASRAGRVDTEDEDDSSLVRLDLDEHFLHSYDMDVREKHIISTHNPLFDMDEVLMQEIQENEALFLVLAGVMDETQERRNLQRTSSLPANGNKTRRAMLEDLITPRRSRAAKAKKQSVRAAALV